MLIYNLTKISNGDYTDPGYTARYSWLSYHFDLNVISLSSGKLDYNNKLCNNPLMACSL